MKTIKAGNILDNAVRLCGRNPAALATPENWKVLAAMAINAGIDRLASEKLPMMQRIEFRRYRPTWTAGTGYEIGQEVWYCDDYFRKVKNGSGAPDEDTCWRILDMSEVVAFINWDQPWENTTMHRAGVDTARFAYVEDPKYHPNATPIRVTAMNSLGIELEAPAPKGVYCRFIPEMPRITFAEWASGPHEPGEVVYRTVTKDCYLCCKDTSEETQSFPPENDVSGTWHSIRIMGEFEAYLTHLVAANLMTLDQGKQQSHGYAEQEFNRICETYHEGNGETAVRVGRFR